MDSGALKREVGLAGAVAYGVGIIVGAGVYALIGRAAGQAGNSVWLSFILAAIVASFTGLSYAELSSMFPVSGAEYVYVEKAFRSKFWAFIIGWLVFLSGVISSSAVALGFGGYLMSYIGISEALTAILLILFLSLVNFWGIKESVKLNVVFTLTEVSGLVLVILFGARYFGSVNYFEAPSGARGIVSAAALIFFAFIGFESLAKIGEETKDPKRTIPRALILALIISTILYAIVALSVVSIIPYDQIALSTSPLADVALKAQGPQAYLILSIIALFATANTVLIILISTSRIAYGMAKESSLPNILSKVHKKRGTPWVAILFTMAISSLFALIGDIELVANVTNFTTFLVFFAVNLALISLRRKRINKKEAFKSPLTIMNVPVLAVFGALSSFIMLLQFDLLIVAIATLVIGLGAIFYKFFLKRS
ncbi:MAG: amino acid permease [archaeon]|nr:amino acid permease [archaeon]